MFFERHVYEDSELPVYFQLQMRNPIEPKYEFHWHETAEFILVLKGCVGIRINNTTSCYKEGDLVVINPQDPHCFYGVGGDCTYYCMIPDNSVFTAGGIDMHSFHTETCIEDEEIKELYRQIVGEFSEKGSCYKSIIKSKLVLMAALLIRRHGKESGNVVMGDNASMRDAISMGDNAMRITKNAIRYMEEHYEEACDGETIAAALGFSRSYLCHVISKVTGQSLTENLRYVRCRKARELLRQGMSVGEVVFLSGFKNSAYFCRTYKRMMGVAPSADRK